MGQLPESATDPNQLGVWVQLGGKLQDAAVLWELLPGLKCCYLIWEGFCLRPPEELQLSFEELVDCGYAINLSVVWKHLVTKCLDEVSPTSVCTQVKLLYGPTNGQPAEGLLQLTGFC